MPQPAHDPSPGDFGIGMTPTWSVTGVFGLIQSGQRQFPLVTARRSPLVPVAAHHACLPEPAVPAPDAGPDPGDQVSPVVLHWPDTAWIEHTRQRYRRTHDLRDQAC